MIDYNNKYVLNDLERITTENINFEKLYNQTILITGATGMLATYLVYTLMHLNLNNESNIKVVALVRNREKAELNFKEFLNEDMFELLVQDVTDKINYTSRLDYIIHAAGNASPTSINDDPVGIIKANTLGTINVLELAKELDVKRVLYLSTREIYGKNISNETLIDEDNYGVVNCHEYRSCYPESKRLAETLHISYANQFEIDYNIVRLAHVFGPGMSIVNDGRVMSDLMYSAVNGENISLNSDGSAIRSFCYISDATSAMFYALLNSKENEVFNISNETEPMSIKSLSELIINMFPEKNIELSYVKSDNLAYSNIGRTELDNSKINSLGWAPKVTLEEGIYRTVRSFELNENRE